MRLITLHYRNKWHVVDSTMWFYIVCCLIKYLQPSCTSPIEITAKNIQKIWLFCGFVKKCVLGPRATSARQWFWTRKWRFFALQMKKNYFLKIDRSRSRKWNQKSKIGEFSTIGNYVKFITVKHRFPKLWPDRWSIRSPFFLTHHFWSQDEPIECPHFRVKSCQNW